MSATDNGGPAYPTSPTRMPSGAKDPDCYFGMSLRDYFAGEAMNGWASGRNAGSEFAERAHSSPEYIAESCYRYADAMLEARKA